MFVSTIDFQRCHLTDAQFMTPFWEDDDKTKHVSKKNMFFSNKTFKKIKLYLKI